MKIERGSVTITDIPYFDSIEVMPSGVLLTGGTSAEQIHTLSDLEVLRDALTEAIRIKREIDGLPAIVTSARVWSEGDDEPGPEITKVRDNDGEIWHRSGDGWSRAQNGYANPWFFVLQYAPLADVTHE